MSWVPPGLLQVRVAEVSRLAVGMVPAAHLILAAEVVERVAAAVAAVVGREVVAGGWRDGVVHHGVGELGRGEVGGGGAQVGTAQQPAGAAAVLVGGAVALGRGECTSL